MRLAEDNGLVVGSIPASIRILRLCAMGALCALQLMRISCFLLKSLKARIYGSDNPAVGLFPPIPFPN
jgi:hypothetical protein